MEGSTGQFQRKGGKSAAQKCGQVPGMEGSTEGNFRGKVESGVQRRSSRRGWLAAAPTTGPRKKTKKRWKGILKEEVAKLDDDLSS